MDFSTAFNVYEIASTISLILLFALFFVLAQSLRKVADPKLLTIYSLLAGLIFGVTGLRGLLTGGYSPVTAGTIIIDAVISLIIGGVLLATLTGDVKKITPRLAGMFLAGMLVTMLVRLVPYYIHLNQVTGQLTP